MELVLHIPWTPRAKLREAAPQSDLCERTIATLQKVIFTALKPFPDARRALSEALLHWSNSDQNRNEERKT